MAYIGNTPAEAFSAFQKQDFTTSATTSYTLDHPVSNQNEIALFINFVRQEPTAAYTASGTTLTLTSATSSSDDMYCVYLGKAVQTVNPASGSVGSSQVASTIITGQTAETSIADADTILIHDDSASALRKMTRSNFLSGVGGVNTPAFSAERSSAQSISDATRTTILFNNEFLDSSSAYDTSTGKFTPQTAGKYFVIANIILQSGSNSNFSFGFVELYKNSSVITESVFDDRGDENSRCYTAAPSAVVDMNGSSDFILIQAYINANSGTPEVSDMSTFTAFKIIE